MADGAPCTFGRKTDIPGMAKFPEQAKMDVWCETVTKEMRSWSDGMKKNPPNKDFKILQPHKMEPLDLKNPMASRAVDHAKDRRARLEAEATMRDLAAKEEAFDTDSVRPHTKFSHDVTTKKDGMSADELDNFMQSLRDCSASPVDRHVNGSYRTHAPESRRSYTPIQSSHEIGWDLAPLSKPGPYSVRNRQKCMRKSCNETIFANDYFTLEKVAFTSRHAGRGSPAPGGN